jgi:hypothetical protein
MGGGRGQGGDEARRAGQAHFLAREQREEDGAV